MAGRQLISFRQIGVVVNNVTNTLDENWGNVLSRLLIDEEFKGGLQGLEQFSHALIITFLQQASFDRERHLIRRPRGLESMPLVGIFSQRAKDRPNPIGVTAVQIVTVGADFVEVKGLDAIDGTPILDVKPYYPQYDLVGDATVPNWVNTLMQGYF